MLPVARKRYPPDDRADAHIEHAGCLPSRQAAFYRRHSSLAQIL